MKRATKLDEIIDVFRPEPLQQEQFEAFYAQTMDIRMANSHSSPMKSLFKKCVNQSADKKAFMLVGHRGCGKSTELNQLQLRLKEAGYQTINIKCSSEIDSNNAEYSDLLVLIAESILKLAETNNCNIDTDLINKITDFFDDTELIKENSKSKSVETEAGIKSVVGLGSLLKLFGSAKLELKMGKDTREIIRKRVSLRLSDWLEMIKLLTNIVSVSGKQPVVILEDLDKIEPPSKAMAIFTEYGSTLSSLPFPIIYTFPISQTYDPTFSSIEAFFDVETLPMIKITQIDNTIYQPGIDIIREIIDKRADLSLFTEDAIVELIAKTGGWLRDLFRMIEIAASRAMDRNNKQIDIEDVNVVIRQEISKKSKYIEEKDFDILIKIYKNENNEREYIKNKEEILPLMQANAILEYNGDRWCNLHPMIADFLKRIGRI